MDLKGILSLVHKRARILLTITLVAILTSSILNLLILDKIYTSTLTLMVNGGNTEYDDILLGEKLVDTYSIIAKGDRVMEAVITELELDMTIKELREQMIVRTQPDKRLLEVTIEDNNPQQALDILNQFLEIFQYEIQDILQVDHVQLIDIPKLPITPTRPKVILNLLISVFAGIIVGLIFIYFLEYMDNTIRDSKEAEKRLKIPVLARVSQIKEKISSPEDADESNSFAYADTFNEDAYIEIITNLETMDVDQDKKIMLITSSMPMQGKNEFIKGLAIAIAQLEKNVLVVDCDFRNPDLYQAFQVENNKGLIDILEARTDYDLNIQSTTKSGMKILSTIPYYKSYVKHIDIPNIEIIPAGIITLNDYKLILSKEMVALLQVLKKNHDMIILSSGPITSQAESLILAHQSDEIILVENYGQSTYSQIEKTVNKLGREKNKIGGIVINHVPSKELKK